MNRRQFFGMSAAAVALAGLPAIVLPERKIFLPPRGGWFPAYRMREVEQYLINNDSLAMRWDMAWILDGEYVQHYVLEEPSAAELLAAGGEQPFLAERREFARKMLIAEARKHGYDKGQPAELKLPSTVMHAAYV